MERFKIWILTSFHTLFPSLVYKLTMVIVMDHFGELVTSCPLVAMVTCIFTMIFSGIFINDSRVGYQTLFVVVCTLLNLNFFP